MRKNLWLAMVIAAVVELLSAGCSNSEPASPRAPSSPAKSATAPPASHGYDPPSSAVSAPPVPPYHESAEAAKPLPKLVPAAYFRNFPLVARAYQIAGEIPEVIAQQPCYCHCDKFGHRSLLDCYASDHGAG